MKAGVDPYNLFASWYKEELELNRSSIPSACCLSTNGLDGFPNARFVSLKTFSSDGFIITGPLVSRKGLELKASGKCALTFWWTETQRQVWIQGKTEFIPGEMAEQFFAERDRASQLVSILSEQGKENTDPGKLLKDFQEALKTDPGLSIEKPSGWGGFLVKPERIEFMQFSADRFHERWLFVKENVNWVVKQLQP